MAKSYFSKAFRPSFRVHDDVEGEMEWPELKFCIEK